MTDQEIRMEIRAWERAREHDRAERARARGDAWFAFAMFAWMLMLLFPLVPFVFAVSGAVAFAACSWMWAIS